VDDRKQIRFGLVGYFLNLYHNSKIVEKDEFRATTDEIMWNIIDTDDYIDTWATMIDEVLDFVGLELEFKTDLEADEDGVGRFVETYRVRLLE